MHAPVLVTPPAAMPVSLPEAKAHLRVDHDDEDDLIEDAVKAAAAYLDGWSGVLGRAVVAQTWRQDFDGWCNKMRLPIGPVTSIANIKSRNSAGQISTVDEDDYSLRFDQSGAYASFNSSFGYPGDLHESAPISIEYVAGPATAAPQVKQMVKLLIGHWYANREAVAEGSFSELPMAVASLIEQYRRVSL